MNAVEIEEAISRLAELPFDAEEFPFAFLEAFGNKATTIKRLRSGTSNKSDVGGVLQTSNIHIKVAEEGAVPEALASLKASPTTAKARAKFILATDGHQGDRSPEPPLCRAPKRQSRMGYGGTSPRHESLHGPADLLLLC